jgi:translocator assembly and maintenance protein 41
MPKEEIGSQYWKYGVIGVDNLVNDLTTWEHLFIAGRLHKPVLDLDSNYFSHRLEDIREARKTNMKAAAAAAMVILPQNFSELDLYYVISGLSYAGDVRLLFGAENPNKLSNMIYKRPQSLHRFRKTFETTLENLESRGLLLRSRKPSTAGSPLDIPIYKFEQNPAMKPELLRSHLPHSVQDAVFLNAESADDLSNQLKNHVFKTVRRSTAKQFVNNLLMNSPLKSSKYAIAKLAKGLLKR